VQPEGQLVEAGVVPIDPATETATHQQVSAHTTDLNLPGNVTLFDSLFVVSRPAADPRGNALTQEAETGRLADARVIRDDNPYNLASGNAFVRYTSRSGFADFTLTANRTGEHWVILRYANNGLATSQMALTINGVRRVVTLGAGAGLGWYRLDGFRGVQLRAGANQTRVAPVRGRAPGTNHNQSRIGGVVLPRLLWPGANSDLERELGQAAGASVAAVAGPATA
jgi:hypothetical protein